MKLVRSTIGYMIAGTIVMSVWGMVMDASLGLIGGILAGFLIIGLNWFMSHHLGLIYHGPNSGFVDIGLGIGLSGIFRDIFVGLFSGNSNVAADLAPTLLFVVIGAVIGGLLAAKVEADMEKDKEIK